MATTHMNTICEHINKQFNQNDASFLDKQEQNKSLTLTPGGLFLNMCHSAKNTFTIVMWNRIARSYCERVLKQAEWEYLPS